MAAEPTRPRKDRAVVWLHPLRRLVRVRAGAVPAVSWWPAMLLGAGALALGLGILAAAWLLARPLMLLFLAIVIAEALAPLVAWLDRWLPRTVAVLLPYLVVLLALGAGGWMVVPPLVSQVQEITADVPALLDIDQAQNWIARWDQLTGGRLTETVLSQLSRVANAIVLLPLVIFSSLLEIVTVLFLSMYWLMVAPSLLRFILSLFPTGQRAWAAAVLDEMGQTMGGYVRGAVIDGLIIGVLAYLGFSLIGVNFALVLAIIAGIFEIVPVVGPILATVPAVAVALLHSWTQALMVLAFWVALQQLESNIITPYVMGTQTHISPLLVLFALFAGLSAAGILGALVAIPLSGALQVFIVRVVAPAVRRWSGAAGPPAAPTEAAA
ncbi:MAG: AI-2E family transporter [Chloroflexi bacterium]|nr:AI-2E family transporter [Chloroflexota bacterium]